MGAMRAQSTRTALDMSDDEQTTGGAGRRGGPTGVSARRQAADIRGFMARDAAPVQKKANEPEGARTEQAPAAQTEFKPADPRGKIAALHPGMQSKARALIEQAHARGLNIWIVDGVRTFAEQNALYAKGRTAPGNIVTPGFDGRYYYVSSEGKLWELRPSAP